MTSTSEVQNPIGHVRRAQPLNSLPLPPPLMPYFNNPPEKRWLWVQFPWMALSGSGVLLASKAATAGAAEGLPNGGAPAATNCSGEVSSIGGRGDATGTGASTEKSRR